jgi:hypothetical protein
MHHIGMLGEVTPEESEPQEEGTQPELPAQEKPGEGEPESDLPECQNHRSFSFLQGNPRSIYSLWFANTSLASFMFVALRYRSCLEPLLHLSYTYLVHLDITLFTPLGSGLSICLAMLSPVEVG